ncbi:hypothetical protein [Streptomyces sp. NPDC050759]
MRYVGFVVGERQLPVLTAFPDEGTLHGFGLFLQWPATEADRHGQ